MVLYVQEDEGEPEPFQGGYEVVVLGNGFWCCSMRFYASLLDCHVCKFMLLVSIIVLGAVLLNPCLSQHLIPVPRATGLDLFYLIKPNRSEPKSQSIRLAQESIFSVELCQGH